MTNSRFVAEDTDFEELKKDFRIDNEGSILILNALTDAAREWVAENITGDEVQRWGRNGTVVEPRYIDNVIAGIEAAGLTIEK